MYRNGLAPMAGEQKHRRTSVPDLRFDRLSVYIDGTSGKFNANSRL